MAYSNGSCSNHHMCCVASTRQAFRCFFSKDCTLLFLTLAKVLRRCSSATEPGSHRALLLSVQKFSQTQLAYCLKT